MIIYADSQALIKALSYSHTISKTIYNLHHNLNTASTNYYMSIEWVPGHTRHYGNELADKPANIRTVTQTTELETSQSPTPHTQYKHKINSYIFNKHKKQWSNSNISNNSKTLVSTILNRNLQGQNLFKLGIEVLRLLTKLIAGHNNLIHFQN